MDAFTLRH